MAAQKAPHEVLAAARAACKKTAPVEKAKAAAERAAAAKAVAKAAAKAAAKIHIKSQPQD